MMAQSSLVHHLHGQSCQIVPYITKILQNFWLTQVFNKTKMNNEYNIDFLHNSPRIC